MNATVTIQKTDRNAYQVSWAWNPYLASAWTIKDCRRHIADFQKMGILPQGIKVVVVP